MKIELSQDQIDDVTQKKIAALEKEVKSLKRRLQTKEKQITEFKMRWKAAQPTISKIQSTASDLCDLLEHAEIVEYARYGETC